MLRCAIRDRHGSELDKRDGLPDDDEVPHGEEPFF